jgi:hypothetical protein
MSLKPRVKAADFSVGDKVEVTAPIRRSHFKGACGQVTEVLEHKKGWSLDEYKVRFDGGNEDQLFWGIELTRRDCDLTSAKAKHNDPPSVNA